MSIRVAKLAFNRGLVSRFGLARADIKRLALAAQVQTNWDSRVLGSMSLRTGWGYLGSSRNDNAARHIPFVFSNSDKALIELTDSKMRVWVSDTLVSRTAVATAVTNGSFDVNIASWTDASDAGGSIAWVAGGYLGITGNGSAAGKARQTLAVIAANQNVEHALNIVIQRGPVTLRVGSTAGDDDYIGQATLFTGSHSLAFTPTGGSVFVEFSSRVKRQVLVDSCAIAGAGVMEVAAPWAAADLGKIRYDESADVIFIGCEGYTQRRIERRSTRSWSVVMYLADDGPMRNLNTGPITITPGALSGNTTLTASAALFKQKHAPSATGAGAIFKVSSSGQRVTQAVTAENQFTAAIKVTGTGTQRPFTVIRAGVFTATVTLQRSLEAATGPWTDVTTYTTAATISFDDGLSNQTAWYRIGVKTGDFTVGTANLELNYSGGSIDGYCRVTSFTSSTVVAVEIMTDFGATVATANWYEGVWSDYRGWPTAVAFHEGRLCWAGKNGVQLSVSDAFDSFLDTTVGASGPINRSIGSGPLDRINWLMSLQRLVMGGEAAEYSIRSSSLDEPLTPTNFNIKANSSQGSATVDPLKVDQSAIFVQRGGTRAYELSLGNLVYGEYDASHLSALVPEVGQPSIVRVAVQRQPDTRAHFVRSDGKVALLVFDKVEQVVCWLTRETDGAVEDVVVLPGDAGVEEDAVYYSVKRTINGATKRYLEKVARFNETGNLTTNKQADAFVSYNQAASSIITGLGHLEAKSVVVWDNGKCLRDANGDIATFVVAAAQITVTNAGAAYQATVGMVGLAYSAPYQSGRAVELMEQLGASDLADEQIITGIALLLADVHAKGLKYGPTLTESDMNDLPGTGEQGEILDPDTVSTSLTTPTLTFPGMYSNDARICLLAKAPRPCTVLAAIAQLEHSH